MSSKRPRTVKPTAETARLLCAVKDAEANARRTAIEHQAAEKAAEKAMAAADAALLRHLKEDLRLPLDVENTGINRGVVVGDTYLYIHRATLTNGTRYERVECDIVVGILADGDA